jgi:Rieske Fe-S protein
MQKQPKAGDRPRHSEPADDDRRGFFAKAASVVIGGLITVFPAAAGLFTFADPLRSRAKAGGDDEPGKLVRVATLEALPDDGVPRPFAVIADRVDAWRRFPNEAIGAVYLRRQKGSDQIEAFNATCPHAGCFVNFVADRSDYQCPCHNSAFDVDGHCKYGPSPRDLDSLTAEVRGDGDEQAIWVRYVDFIVGVENKQPKP